MAVFFSSPVTSSPIRQRQPFSPDDSCQSLGLSLLSPDSSYSCYSINPVTGSPCHCRRSPRLLSNGYYVLTEDSYAWDDEGNVSLTPSKIKLSYKENLVRIFRRKRRARRSLASLLCDMTETCQTWLDEKVFGGVRPVPLAESSWVDGSTDLDTSCSFTYDDSEIITPPGKLSEEPVTQEESCTETCHSQEKITQSVGGLLDVPPTSAFHSHSCCSSDSKSADYSTVKALFFISFLAFFFAAIFSRCLATALTTTVITFMVILTSLVFTKSGPLGKWRKAKTEVITSRNE